LVFDAQESWSVHNQKKKIRGDRLAFSPTYDEGDIAPVAIDAIVKFMAVIGAFAALIGLVLAFNFVRGRLK